MKKFKIKQLLIALMITTILTVGGIKIYKGIKETNELKQYSTHSIINKNEILTKDMIVTEIKNSLKLQILQVSFNKEIKVSTGSFLTTKSQNITFKGVGNYLIDIDSINSDNVQIDNKTQTITIFTKLPMKQVEFIESNTTYGKTNKSVLSFGDLKLTIEEYEKIKDDLKQQILSEMDSEDLVEQAIDRGNKAIKDILTTLTKDDYNIVIKYVR